jgi:hypothetical protein
MADHLRTELVLDAVGMALFARKSKLPRESLGYRLPPGQGPGHSVAVRVLRENGVRLRVIAVDVTSDGLVSRGVEAAGGVAAQAARQVLGRAATARTPSSYYSRT